MNWNKLFSDRQAQDRQGGLASWEEPYLPPRQQILKHWREIRLHLWGPAGSMVFHVVALGALVTFTLDSRKEYVETGIVDVPIIYKPEPIEPPPVVPTKTELRTPDPIEDPQLTDENPQSGFDEQDSFEPEGGSGLQEEGAGLGKGPSTLPNKSMEINVVNTRMILIGLTTGPSSGGPRNRLKKHISNNPTALISENAVLRALRWLKREQQPDGSWVGSKQDVRPAMTSMALLAFLGHGETPTTSVEFGPTVKRGLAWLLANQESDGHFKGRDAHDYTQPIAAYALCEAYTLTGHLQVREAAIRAMMPVVLGQNASGGFNYNLDQSLRNDSSYMAWCCQALKAAKSAKLSDDVPGLAAAMKKAVAGFKRNADPNGGFGYEGRGRSGLSGAGILCLQLLGAPTAPEVAATLKFLEPCRFSFATPDQQPYGGGSQLYYWYYITQAKFNHSKETFELWDKQFSPELRRTQQIEKSAITGPDGKLVDVGHWESPVKGEHTGGVVQDTALCTLMLEVYYRYLSAWQTLEIDPDVAALAADGKKDDDVAVIIR